MAPAPTVTAEPSRRPVPERAVVTCILVADKVAADLAEILDALAAQTRRPDHVVVVDTSPAGAVARFVREDPVTSEALPGAEVIEVPGAAPRAAVARVLERQLLPEGATHVWLLTEGSLPGEDALDTLLTTLVASPSAGVAGPKHVSWDHPGRLQRLGIQSTRLGRLVPSPVAGERDQGQYDHRTDTLAVPMEGMLVERDLFERLRGFDVRHGELGADLDLSWRAQHAGRRVVVVPSAAVRVRGRSGSHTSHERRQARRVALSRCAWWSLPFLALRVLVGGVLAAAGLLLLKRPRAAWRELSDTGALLAPWRILRARVRSRGTRTVARRDLTGVFVGRGDVGRRLLDSVHDAVSPEGRATVDPGADDHPDHADPLRVRSALANPGLLAVLATTVVVLVASRSWPGGLLQRLETGLSGGELPGVRADSATLWHAWWDGWHGAGLGGDGPQSPALVVLAGLTWLLEHVPGTDPVASPVGAALAWFLLVALPLACLTAYLSARVLTRTRWARGLAAVAWASTAVAGAAVSDGRVGALVALVLLPPVAAGLVTVARRSGTTTATFATVLAAAVLGAFVPALLVLVVVAGLAIVALGSGAARLRGLAVAVLPVLLLGPWVLALLADPRLLLAGQGTTVWGGSTVEAWEVALLHPGGPGSYAVLASVPLVALGVLSLARAGRSRRLTDVVAGVAVLGLAAALLAPHLVLDRVPEGAPDAGGAITAWSGTGLLVLTLALLAASMLAVDALPLSRGDRRAPLGWIVVAFAVAGVLGSAGLLAYGSFGERLTTWTDPRPAVAIEQADGQLKNRVLAIDTSGQDIAYAVLATEAGDVVRGLPAELQATDAVLEDALARLVDGGPGATPGGAERDPVAVLASRAIGFVQLPQEAPDSLSRRLDSTSGLSRLAPHQGRDVWRVLASGAGAPTDAVAPSRLTVVADGARDNVDIDGEHAATTTTVNGDVLHVAEPAGWAEHAEVVIGGDVVEADTSSGQPVYALPGAEQEVEVTVLPEWPLWQRAQGVLLLLVVFLAVPFGTAASRRKS